MFGPAVKHKPTFKHNAAKQKNWTLFSLSAGDL